MVLGMEGGWKAIGGCSDWGGLHRTSLQQRMHTRRGFLSELNLRSQSPSEGKGKAGKRTADERNNTAGEGIHERSRVARR